MYNDSVDFVVKSIQKTPLVNLNGLIYQEYQDFFDDVWLEKLKIDTKSIKLEKLNNQETKKRARVHYEEKISKELNIFFRNNKITTCLEDIFMTKLKPNSSDIWIDYPGYSFKPHTDDPSIKVALQIYIGEGNHPGTTLYSIPEPTKLKGKNIDIAERVSDKDKIYEIKYKKNKGYGLLNNEMSCHGVSPVIDGERISVYARYGKK
jgi:hypothetical protein